MSKPYQLVVFDWEGTISDTLGLILQTVAEEASRLGFGTLDFFEARRYVDLGLVKAMRKLFPHLSMTQHEDLLQAVQQVVVSRPNDVCLFPGVREFIMQLHAANIDLAIATNKGHASLSRALESAGLDGGIFKITRSAGQVPPKPCPQMLAEIIEQLGGHAASTLMIGDSPTDMEMAKSIQVDAIGVDFYHHQKSALIAAGASAVFDDYQLLAQFLNLAKF